MLQHFTNSYIHTHTPYHYSLISEICYVVDLIQFAACIIEMDRQESVTTVKPKWYVSDRRDVLHELVSLQTTSLSPQVIHYYKILSGKLFKY
jgi:hypothetical protein